MNFSFLHLNLKYIVMNLMLVANCLLDWRISFIMIKLKKIIKLYKSWIIKLNLKKNNLLTIIFNSSIFKNTFKTPQSNFVINNKLSIKWTNKKSYLHNNQLHSSNQKRNFYLYKKKKFFKMFKLLIHLIFHRSLKKAKNKIFLQFLLKIWILKNRRKTTKKILIPTPLFKLLNNLQLKIRKTKRTQNKISKKKLSKKQIKKMLKCKTMKKQKMWLWIPNKLKK